MSYQNFLNYTYKTVSKITYCQLNHPNPPLDLFFQFSVVQYFCYMLQVHKNKGTEMHYGSSINDVMQIGGGGLCHFCDAMFDSRSKTVILV